MTKPEPLNLARRGELIALVSGKEEVRLSEDSESMWLEVIRKMDEVYADLIGYETDLERKNAELEEARDFIASVVASVSNVLLVCDEKSDLVEINPERNRVRVRARLALGGGLRPPTLHPCLELFTHWDPQPRVQTGDLPDRVVLHRAKVDVVEPIPGDLPKFQRTIHTQRPVLDIQPADIAAVDLAAERPDDVGV